MRPFVLPRNARSSSWAPASPNWRAGLCEPAPELYERFVIGSLPRDLRRARAGDARPRHPFLCKRAAALQELSQPGSVVPTGRNLWADPLAPFLGFASAGGSASSAVMMIATRGMLMAIAIPNFVKFQQRALAAKAAQAQPLHESSDEETPLPPSDGNR